MSVRVSRVLAPNPGVYTLEGTNTWVVGGPPAMVIDPGPDTAAHIDAVLAEADAVEAILLTHGHEDHAEGARRLAERTGAPVYSADPAAGDVRLRDGETLRFGGTHVEVVETPGHTPDHMVFRLTETGAMFTGDAILGRGTSVIDPPEGDLVSYLRSMDRLAALGPKTLFPGHGPTIFAGALKIREYIEHRGQREKQVLQTLDEGPRSVEQMVKVIYADYPTDVQPLAARSLVAHLLKLEREDRVAREGRGEQTMYSLKRPRACSKCGRPVRGNAPLCPRCSMDALQEKPAFE